MALLVLCALLAVGAAGAAGLSEAEYRRFPRLFHLDEYEACLSPAGLYCLGTFSLAPARAPHRTFRLLQEYSLDRHHFNRTVIHRGYCVSARCGGGGGGGAGEGEARRFERCAARRAARRGLRARLQRLHYCASRRPTAPARAPTAPHRAFLAALLLLGALNAAGTLYDLITDDDTNKRGLALAWSVRANWRRLTARHERGDPRLAALLPAQGCRVVLLMLTMLTHAACIQDMTYVYNPRFIEQASRHPLLVLFLNGTSVVQIFVMLSSFLLAYNMLLVSRDRQLSLKRLPHCILYRVARIAPVYLLVVGYAATWWERGGEGPLWKPLVGAEAATCRRKWWWHVLFLHNLVEPQNHCLVQTWFIAVDMQLHVVAAALTLGLAGGGARRALPVLGALLAAACVLNVLLAYCFQWQPLLHFTNPESLRTMYRDVPSFSMLYTSPWGSLPASLLGLFLAHLHYHLQEIGFKLFTLTWWRAAYGAALPLALAWLAGGAGVRGAGGAAGGAALLAALERPALAAPAALLFLGMINGATDPLRAVLAWRGWHAMGRLSLAVLMLHWCLNMSLVAQRPQPVHASVLSVATDFVATGVSSYALAVPLTLLVEMPVHRSVSSLMF